ncbi:glycosyltransferase family 2 protein [Patescibacteria group bacterium]|nr:glycosyltransferase family 2 protein [Patescibacteria group bacterium]MBU4141945.1 glycosyltransferase family 2 protein [Patescibacteria group bacterium]
MNNHPLVTINLVVRNGEKYIRHCLKAIKNQSYPNLEVIVFDNNSSDKTPLIVKQEFSQFQLIENSKNCYVGGGFNRCIELSRGEYILALCVDVICEKDFIKNAARRMENDKTIGALQSKTLIYDFKNQKPTDNIDTAGFEIFRSRRIINRGHGAKDIGQFEKPEEIFSYEGAAGFFRKEALQEAKINEQIFDEDFVWYADDIDLGWRLNLFGWKNFYDPSVIAWHDRSTTQRLSRGYRDFIQSRKNIPPEKKRWDYINQRLMMVKNDITAQFLCDFPFFIFREAKLWIYFLLFERSTLSGVFDFIKLSPKMAAKRKIIMSKKKPEDKEIKNWFK